MIIMIREKALNRSGKVKSSEVKVFVIRPYSTARSFLVGPAPSGAQARLLNVEAAAQRKSCTRPAQGISWISKGSKIDIQIKLQYGYPSSFWFHVRLLGLNSTSSGRKGNKNEKRHSSLTIYDTWRMDKQLPLGPLDWHMQSKRECSPSMSDSAAYGWRCCLLNSFHDHWHILPKCPHLEVRFGRHLAQLPKDNK